MRNVVAAVTLVALGQTAGHLIMLGPPTPDQIGPLLAAYESVEGMLPAGGSVGFLATSQDEVLNTVNYYVAQQALAPRVLTRDLGSTTEFIVTTTGIPQDGGGHPALSGFRLAGTGVLDVRVFRRRQP